MKRVFEFPGIYRLWGSVMVALALVVGPLSVVLAQSQPQPPQERWIMVCLVAISCGLFIVMGLYLFIAWSGQLILTEQEIIWTRFNQKITLYYQDILQVQHGTIPPVLIITAPSGQITIHKQIQGYDELYSLLQKHVPVLREAVRMSFPLEITARLGNLIGYSVLSLVPLGLAVMIGLSPTRYASSPALAAGLILVLASMAVGVLYFFVLKPPFRYTFTSRQIIAQSLLGQQTFDAALIQSVRMAKTIVTRWGVDRAIYSIVIEFSDGRQLAIEQDTIRYPLEQLLDILQSRYSATSGSSAMRATNSA